MGHPHQQLPHPSIPNRDTPGRITTCALRLKRASYEHRQSVRAQPSTRLLGSTTAYPSGEKGMGRSDGVASRTAARGDAVRTRARGGHVTTSRTGTTRWLHNAATAKRSARAAGLEHCPICHVRLTWDAGLLPSSPEADHIVPHSRGGNDSIDNIQIICLVKIIIKIISSFKSSILCKHRI